MNRLFLIIVVHQLLFQGMFIAKNIILSKQTGKKIQGKNPETIHATIFFAAFIILSFYLGFSKDLFGQTVSQYQFYSTSFGLLLLILNFIISAAALKIGVLY